MAHLFYVLSSTPANCSLPLLPPLPPPPAPAPQPPPPPGMCPRCIFPMLLKLLCLLQRFGAPARLITSIIYISIFLFLPAAAPPLALPLRQPPPPPPQLLAPTRAPSQAAWWVVCWVQRRWRAHSSSTARRGQPAAGTEAASFQRAALLALASAATEVPSQRLAPREALSPSWCRLEGQEATVPLQEAALARRDLSVRC